MIKVMIVDDSAVVRETMTSILSAESDIEVIATASDPVIALTKLKTISPDVITLDIEMPRMDGVTFLKQLMETKPIPVIICSSMAENGSSNAMLVMEYGAVEIIQKPKMGTRAFLEESRIKICDAVHAAYLAKNRISSYGIRGAKQVQHSTEAFSRSIQPKQTADVILDKGDPHSYIDTTEKIVVVGASTGGTEALKVFLEMLPVDAPGMVIVQHMPEHFTRSFAERLNGLCRVRVAEARNNDSVVRGTVLIAPGNKHTLLKRSGARYYVEVKDGPLVSRHRPSVDVLFRSASRYAGKNAVGVIMTGMGDDGAKGMLEMHEAGSYCIAQDEKSCIVFGMPAEAIKAGGTDIVLPLQKIAEEVLKRAR
ncbi:MAG: chemotaxis response regulator protein-glutamate methylesterase [Bacteroides sp.]|nr:chemotaxis response regulator protein-glutamate methylesterase [Prevotella sp.]MCM1406998.1 chemotaxis response regulator protein-glutamate methylesterase [Treponema brennaborense]MCM1470149.1 chemotaxis response regulator protein-glutamate methylesterase [Bacteroides sp.]